MEGFRSLIIMTVVFIIVILLIALPFKKKKMLVPIIINLLSVVLVLSSFKVGRWEGTGLGFVGLSIYLSSIIGFRFLLKV